RRLAVDGCRCGNQAHPWGGAAGGLLEEGGRGAEALRDEQDVRCGGGLLLGHGGLLVSQPTIRPLAGGCEGPDAHRLRSTAVIRDDTPLPASVRRRVAANHRS